VKHDNTYIKAIGLAQGSNQIDNFEQAATFDLELEFVNQKIGVSQLPQRDTEQTTVSLAFQAVQSLLEQEPSALDNLSLIILVSQNPDFGGLPHNSAILHGMLDLPNSVACFDVSLGCSGYAYGLGIVASMRASGINGTALLVTSDQYRPFLKPEDKNTRLLFGDWAAATLIDENGPYKVVASQMETIGSGYKNLIREQDGISMNGRGVFTFARNIVSSSLTTFCDTNCGGASNVDRFLVHQGSKAVVNELARRIDVPPDRMPVSMDKTGNGVSSSIPMLLKDRLNGSDNRIVACGFGVGLSIGNVLLERG
jgi:3-oxoacyl-[acyl-carrier-protein] synthase-3